MILGIDVGNYATKISPNICIKSSVEQVEGINGNQLALELNGATYYIGENSLETTLNKASKDNYMPLLITSILLSSKDVENNIIVGLPIGQYKENKDQLKEMILSYKIKNLKLNGIERELKIKKCEVQAESLATYYSMPIKEDCIIVDIGGRTTDICYITDNKVVKHSTKAIGTLNIYSDVANAINNKFSTNLDIQLAEKVVSREKLEINGVNIDVSFLKDILKNNFNEINRELEVNYPVKVEKIVLTGGGGKMFHKPFEKRYKVELVKNYIYSNSLGFQKVGEMLWL